MSDELEIVLRIADIDSKAWDKLAGDDDPFAEHAFLLALETSHSVGRGTGWTPRHVTLKRNGELVGALPLYLKQHSYGEYIFDFAWASAAERAGVRYYPKLVAMVPFTPATGRRFLYAPGEDPQRVTSALLDGAFAVLKREHASSIHLHFMNEHERDRVAHDGRFLARMSTQFHWTNHDFKTFDDHLATFRSVARKEAKKERRRAAASGLELSVQNGTELGDIDWQALADFYFDTCEKHGSGPYLTRLFFDEIRKTHAHRVVAALAKRDGVPVAGTLNFEKGQHLYGRYWGASEQLDYLHFELCYHRLIERAIEHGVTRFEAGAQGTHKLRRGLLPAEIYNACYIEHPQLAQAVGDFLVREREGLHHELAALMHHGPSHRDE